MKLLLFFLLIINASYGQLTATIPINLTMPSIAILDIEPIPTAFTLNLTAPTEAGNPAVSTVNNSKWINFTSAVPLGTTRRITVQYFGILPSGLNIRLNTSAYSGSGAGPRGNAVSLITLSAVSQTVINNIGGAFTGNGSSNGYNLSYSLTISNYSLLRFQSSPSPITITYTMIDN